MWRSFGAGITLLSAYRVARGAAMKIALSILVALSQASAAAQTADFPSPGTPYAEVRAALLKQGLQIAPVKRRYDSDEEREALKGKGIIAPQPVPSPAPQFGEIDCWKLDWERDPGVKCRALFLETVKDGWKQYVVVSIDPKTLMVGDIGYSTTTDGLPSIPPTLAKDVPQIRGPYFASRQMLKAQGFHPARNHKSWWRGTVCTDPDCKRYTTLPEAGCSGTGAAFCIAYWIAKDGRVLKVTTIWEYPQVYFAAWSSRKELKSDFGK